MWNYFNCSPTQFQRLQLNVIHETVITDHCFSWCNRVLTRSHDTRCFRWRCINRCTLWRLIGVNTEVQLWHFTWHRSSRGGLSFAAHCLMKLTTLTPLVLAVLVVSFTRVNCENEVHAIQSECPDRYTSDGFVSRIFALWIESETVPLYASFESYVNYWFISDGERFFRLKWIGSYEDISPSLIAVPDEEPYFWREVVSLKLTLTLIRFYKGEQDRVFWTEKDTSSHLNSEYNRVFRRKGDKFEWIGSARQMDGGMKLTIASEHTHPWERINVTTPFLRTESSCSPCHERTADFAIPYEHRVLHGRYYWLLFRKGFFHLEKYVDKRSFTVQKDYVSVLKRIPICIERWHWRRCSENLSFYEHSIRFTLLKVPSQSIHM